MGASSSTDLDEAIVRRNIFLEWIELRDYNESQKVMSIKKLLLNKRQRVRESVDIDSVEIRVSRQTDSHLFAAGRLAVRGLIESQE